MLIFPHRKSSQTYTCISNKLWELTSTKFSNPGAESPQLNRPYGRA